MAIEGTTETRAPRIRLGMVGGGSGAFIGAVHRIAARIDDHYDLVAGLCPRRRKSRASRARNWGSTRPASMTTSSPWRSARRG